MNFDKVGLKDRSWVVCLRYAQFFPWFETWYAYKRYAYKKTCTPLSVTILLTLNVNSEVSEEHKLYIHKFS